MLTANPYYNRPGQEGQYQHFRAIAGGGRATDPAVQHSFADGRKPGAGDGAATGRDRKHHWDQGVERQHLAQITELITRAPGGFKVLSGDDGLALPVIALGGCGLVSVASNAIPAQMAKMVRCGADGRMGGGARDQREVLPLDAGAFLRGQPCADEGSTGTDGADRRTAAAADGTGDAGHAAEAGGAA